MKFLYLLLILMVIACHTNSKKPETSEMKQKLITQFDTLKYNTRLYTDTSGCSWLFEHREIIDTLKYEKVTIMRKDAYKILKTSDYGQYLWVCDIPKVLIDRIDTFLVSGYVYRTYSNERVPGRPTLIKEIVYTRK